MILNDGRCAQEIPDIILAATRIVEHSGNVRPTLLRKACKTSKITKGPSAEATGTLAMPSWPIDSRATDVL